MPSTAYWICNWFAMCTNHTTKAAPHPILDWVPCCDRCATKMEIDPATLVEIETLL